MKFDLEMDKYRTKDFPLGLTSPEQLVLTSTQESANPKPWHPALPSPGVLKLIYGWQDENCCHRGHQRNPVKNLVVFEQLWLGWAETRLASTDPPEGLQTWDSIIELLVGL